MTALGRALALGVAGATAAVGSRVVGRALVARTEARLCTISNPPPYRASERARALHERLWLADLHADSLLWGRDLLERSDRGHVDVPPFDATGLVQLTDALIEAGLADDEIARIMGDNTRRLLGDVLR